MRVKHAALAAAILASTVALASRVNAGADMVIDNSAQAPPPAYTYAPPPPVYYVRRRRRSWCIQRLVSTGRCVRLDITGGTGTAVIAARITGGNPTRSVAFRRS